MSSHSGLPGLHGFRIIEEWRAVRLYSRPGNEFTRRFLLIVETLTRLHSRSCIIDGGAVACDDNGVAGLPSGTARVSSRWSHHRP